MPVYGRPVYGHRYAGGRKDVCTGRGKKMIVYKNCCQIAVPSGIFPIVILPKVCYNIL